MKKSIVVIAVVALLIVALTLASVATNVDLADLFKKGFGGYTSEDGQIITNQYVSSQAVQVTAGETVWFGPCDPVQYFHLIGQDADGKAVTDKIRGKHLTVEDEFRNGMVIYSYTVPEGVSQLVFSAPSTMADIYTVAKTAFDELQWRAYWDQQGVNTEDFAGKSSYYKVSAGDQLYIGAVKLENVLASEVFDAEAKQIGTVDPEDLRLVESFGSDYGIYCYTVPAEQVGYVFVSYDVSRMQYYQAIHTTAAESLTDEEVLADYLEFFGVPKVLKGTEQALSGKSALFLGDSITFGARDRANIYGVVSSVNEGAGGWAARIGYYAGMNVTNNGVSGACISTARNDSHSAHHYIYNTLVATAGKTYDYVIMHGLFNDASENVPIGTMQGKDDFDPAKADVTTYAGGLELLFHTARQQNPEAILGFIVNFHTDRAVDQGPYAAAAIAICENWGIEYLDLYNRTGFSVEFDDGLHPSSLGYDTMYGIVANWMATLDGTLAAEEKTGYQKATLTQASIMSYNIFWNIDAQEISDRAGKIANLIQTADPDVLLLQEAHVQWLQTLQNKGLSGYTAYGWCAGNVTGSTHAHTAGCDDEMAPILWKTDKYDLVDSGYLHVEAEKYPRTINYVVLKDKSTNAQLLVMNYHAVPDKTEADGNIAFDGESVRRQTAQKLAWELEKIRAEHPQASMVLAGDCNMSMSSVAYYTLLANGLHDGRKVAADTISEGSYNAWDRTDSKKYALGDYIFTGDGVQVEVFDILFNEDFDSNSGKHFSDHSPLVAQIKY